MSQELVTKCDRCRETTSANYVRFGLLPKYEKNYGVGGVLLALVSKTFLYVFASQHLCMECGTKLSNIIKNFMEKKDEG